MMNVRDLRIGNFVFGVSDRIELIVGIRNYGEVETDHYLPHLLSAPTTEDIKYIKPIPLTEEWLERFGFKKEKGAAQSKEHGPYFSKYTCESKYCFAFANFRDDYGLYIEYTDSPFHQDHGRKYIIDVGFKYVHQLQNLYFALTGTELEIKDV